MVDFDRLRDIQKKEKQTDELVKLNEKFYKKVGKYIEQLEQEIERQDGKAKLLLQEELDSTIKVIENIFHHRTGKIIAKTTRYIQNEEPDTKKMLPIEKEIYNSISNDLQKTKNKVMQQIKPNQQPKTKTNNQKKTNENKPKNQETDQQKTDKQSTKTFNNSQQPYTVVRILDNFPRFVSSDHRTHHLSKEDIVCIPNNDAEVLMERNIAYKIKIGE